MGVLEPLTVHSWSTLDKGEEERPVSGVCGAEGTRLHTLILFSCAFICLIFLSDSPQLVLLFALFGFLCSPSFERHHVTLVNIKPSIN